MDEGEFDAFYASSHPRVVAQVYALIGDRDEAAECVQEAFARAWSHHRTLDRSSHPEAWVRTTAHRIAVSRWRRTTRGRRPADRALAASATAAPPSADHVLVVEALRRLPSAQREAVVLHHIADLPVEEVARQVGAPVGTVKARLSRGRTALAALIADDQDLREGRTRV